MISVAPLSWSGPAAHAAAAGGEPGFSTDFNGNGFSDTVVADNDRDEFADLMVGSPYEDVGVEADAGWSRSSGAARAVSTPPNRPS